MAPSFVMNRRPGPKTATIKNLGNLNSKFNWKNLKIKFKNLNLNSKGTWCRTLADSIFAPLPPLPDHFKIENEEMQTDCDWLYRAILDIYLNELIGIADDDVTASRQRIDRNVRDVLSRSSDVMATRCLHCHFMWIWIFFLIFFLFWIFKNLNFFFLNFEFLKIKNFFFFWILNF